MVADVSRSMKGTGISLNVQIVVEVRLWKTIFSDLMLKV